MTKAKRNSSEGAGDNSNKNGAADAPDHQDGDEHESGSGETHVRVGNFSQPDESSGIRDDDVGVAQADEGDKQADACGGAVLEAIGNAVDDLFAHIRKRKNQKEQPGKKNDAESGLPGYAPAEDNGVGEIGVEGHAGSEGYWIVGPQSYDERGDRRRNTRREENPLDGHTRFRKDARVDHDHVGHGHESGEAPEQLTANGSVIFFEMKYALEQACFLQIKRCATI